MVYLMAMWKGFASKIYVEDSDQTKKCKYVDVDLREVRRWLKEIDFEG